MTFVRAPQIVGVNMTTQAVTCTGWCDKGQSPPGFELSLICGTLPNVATTAEGEGSYIRFVIVVVIPKYGKKTIIF